jgi:RNA polymerase sigma-70 factor (ECF subfamily)
MSDRPEDDVDDVNDVETRRTVEAVARASYGRLLAYLSRETRDVAGAEDALSETLLAALTSWPKDGVPRQPEAWLLTAARHRLIDQARRQRVRLEHEDTVRFLTAESAAAAVTGDAFADRRAELLFVCAHPAIDPSLHTPLMLQTVLGLDAARIAQAFLVPPATMGQRLVRAKRKILEAGIPFELPEENDLPQRLDAVLEAIYAAYGLGRDEVAGVDQPGQDLAEEAVWLARVVLDRLPDEPEIRGLLALMLFCDARRAARRTLDGHYIPLSEQNPAAWSALTIREAETELAAASRLGRIGRFQLEAAIQSVHAERAQTGRTDWAAIVVFYEHLVQLAPTLGARVAQAAAVAEAHGAAAGLAQLDRIDKADKAVVAAYQPFWAVRAHLLRQAGYAAAAVDAYDVAIGLTKDPATRQFLLDRRG